MAEKRKEHLTSSNVELLVTQYGDFKKINKLHGMTLGKLINRCMDLYTTDKDFRKLIDEHNKLMIFEKNF